MSQTPATPTAIRNIRPLGDAACDLTLADGRIIGRAEASETPLQPGEVDGRGLLALPGLVNAHAHLDKSWWGLPWQPYGGESGTEGRIRWEREHRDALGIPSASITAAVLAEFVRHGTTAIRSHVDVDPGIGLRGVEAVREAAAAYDGALLLELVAFPQDGLLRRPGTLELLAEAIRAGVEHVGGLDPAGIDRDPVSQLDAIFSLAADSGAGIDIHLHDGAELGAFQIELIIERTERLGLAGRVNIAHGFAMAQISSTRRRDLLQAMAALQMTMTTVAPLRMPQLSLEDFDAAGVPLGLGTDGIRDLWSPYGTGDLLQTARQYAQAAGLVRDDDLTRVVALATDARFAGGTASTLSPGDRADIVLVDAENVMDALVRAPARALVVAGGRIVHTA